jgi:hypothetical protein
MISYNQFQVVLTDDQDRNRPPAILPATATTAEIEAAAAAYFGEAATRQQPDYVGFYSALLGSSVYSAVLVQPATADLARAMVVFVSAIQDCMAGRENRPAMQGAIWLLLSQIPLDVAHAAELTGLMNQYHLAGVYQLQPTPERARNASGQFIPDDPATPDVDEAWA